MIKFFIAYFVVMCSLCGMWFWLKDAAASDAGRKRLLQSLVFSGSVISITSVIFFIFVHLF